MSYSAYRPEIRFADIDAMGHVNNAVYFSYFEQARMQFFKDIVGRKWDWNVTGIIVARNEVDYKAPVFLHDEVHIHLACDHIGNKSFTLSYEVVRTNADGTTTVCAAARSTLVCFNHATGASIAVPTEWRTYLEKMLSANPK